MDDEDAMLVDANDLELSAIEFFINAPCGDYSDPAPVPGLSLRLVFGRQRLPAALCLRRARRELAVTSLAVWKKTRPKFLTSL